jgi:hypothetical protein
MNGVRSFDAVFIMCRALTSRCHAAVALQSKHSLFQSLIHVSSSLCWRAAGHGWCRQRELAELTPHFPYDPRPCAVQLTQRVGRHWTMVP